MYLLFIIHHVQNDWRCWGKRMGYIINRILIQKFEKKFILISMILNKLGLYTDLILTIIYEVLDNALVPEPCSVV
jgi:hypothetical protein